MTATPLAQFLRHRTAALALALGIALVAAGIRLSRPRKDTTDAA